MDEKKIQPGLIEAGLTFAYLRGYFKSVCRTQSNIYNETFLQK